MSRKREAAEKEVLAKFPRSSGAGLAVDASGPKERGLQRRT